MLHEPGRAPVRVKLHRTRVIERAGHHGEPGAIVATGPSGIEIACGEGRLALLELQLEGRKKLGAAEFLVGRRLSEGTRIGREGEGA